MRAAFYFAFLLPLLFGRSAFSAPINDNFADRERLDGTVATATSSNSDATKEAGEPNHAGDRGGSSVWWLWRPPEEGLAVIDTVGSSFDTLLGVYFGKDFQKLDLIAANNNAGALTTSQVLFDASPTRDYSIAVDGQSGVTGTIQLNLRLYTLPVIQRQPQGLEVTDGENAMFSVEALGKRALSYQWQRFGTNLPGEVGSTLIIQVATKAQAGPYRVIVSNTYGSVTSAPPAVLRVVERPKIVEHPVDASREDGDSVEFKVRAVGEAPLRYVWEYKATGDGNYAALPNSPNAPLLALDNLSLDEIGFYRVRVTNTFGEAISDGARLQVIADRPRITEALTNRTVIEGTNVLFVAKVRGHRPFQFTWYRHGTVVPGENAAEYLIPSARTNDTGFYKFMVSNRYGTNSSQDALLTVEPRPPNDDLEKRIDLSFETNVVYGFNKNGTRQTNEPTYLGQPARHSVWWSYMATNRGVLTVDLDGSLIDTVLTVFRGTNLADLDRVAENDDFVTDLETGATRLTSAVQLVVTNGNEYLIAVDGKNGAQADWAGNQGRGGLAIAVEFNSSFGAPFFAGGLDGFLFGGGGGGPDGGGGVDGCGQAVFTLKASSLVPFGYQWQYNLQCLTDDQITNNTGGIVVPPELPQLMSRTNWFGVPCTAEEQWVSIAGATNDTLTLTNITVRHTGQYRLTAFNLDGSGSSTSAPSRLVVSPLPIIRTNLPPLLVARECDYRELIFIADGSCYPFSYEWYFRGRKLDIPSTNRLAFTNGHPTLSGAYYAVARNQYGGSTSRVCQVTFDATPRIKVDPRSLSQPAKDCDELALSVEVEPQCRTNRFLWIRNGVQLSQETNAIIRFRATAETAGDYQVRVYNEFASTNSAVAKVPVDARPFIEEHPETARPKRVLVGGSFTNLVKVQSCSELTFDWRKDGVPVALNNSHIVRQELVDPVRSIVWCEFVVTNAQPVDSGRYDVEVRSGNTNVVSRSGEVQVLYPPPNDHFVNRITLPSTPELLNGTNYFTSATKGTNILASSESAEPLHARQEPRRSVWWTWTSPTPSEVTLDLIGSDFDTLLSVYQGNSLPTLRRIVDDDQSGGNGTSKAKFLAARGKVFNFAVDGSGGAEGFISLQLRAQEIISPPIILAQPRSIAATNGATASFSVEAYGSPDILYQWFFNGTTPLTGATNSTLIITNVQESHEGNYTVRLKNEYGETNSVIARLTFGIIIEGQVTDATNRRGIPGARISVGDQFTFSDTNGNYILTDVRPGAAKADFDAKKRVVRIKEPVLFNNRPTLRTIHLHAEKTNYFDYDDYQFTAELGQSVTNKFSMSPIFDGVRFVLNWDLEPADLDTHLLTPPINGQPYHVQYPQADRGQRDRPPFATLDFDVQDSYGPETLTIYRLENGLYRFYVKKFDPGARGLLSASRAAVKIYTRGTRLGPDGLYGTREVPTVGDGSVWHVCDIDGVHQSVIWSDALLPAAPADPNVEKHLPPAVSSAARHGVSRASIRPQGLDYPGIRFLWDFGDGNTSTNVEPEHSYQAPGSYTVKLSMFEEGQSSRQLDIETKTNFITVYNELPLVTLTSPPDGKLYHTGMEIPLTAEAFDLDGEIRSVAFYSVRNGITNSIATVTLEPYEGFIKIPEPGTYSIFARAIDDFGGVGVSSISTIRVIDLSGDILIVRNFSDVEIDQMVEYLDGLRIPDGPLDSRAPVVRILDQEGLYLELINHFKLVIWHDLGDLAQGITDADALLFNSLKEAGIAIYLIGEHVAGSLGNLADGYTPWQKLTHFEFPVGSEPPGTVTLNPDNDNRTRFFREYGTVRAFAYDHPTELVSLSSTNADVVIALNSNPVFISAPAFREPDYGYARCVSQNFRVVSGPDEESNENRRKLFLNTVAWLLRLTDCDLLGLNVVCDATPSTPRLGEPIILSAVITQNGECDAGGILLTNLLSPGLELISYELTDLSGSSDIGSVRHEEFSGGLVTRFSQLSKPDLLQLRLTVVPTRGGTLTNRYSLYFRPFRPEEFACEQVLIVDVPPCDAGSLRLEFVESVAQGVRLEVSGDSHCQANLQISEDFHVWTTVRTVDLAEGPLTLEVPLSHTVGTTFFRVTY